MVGVVSIPESRRMPPGGEISLDIHRFKRSETVARDEGRHAAGGGNRGTLLDLDAEVRPRTPQATGG